MLVVFIVTRNEGELLRLNLAHHLHWGFDHVLVADNESTDGTQDVIASFGNAVTSMRIARPNDRFDALGVLARRIEPRLGASAWIAFSDTDEFWWMPHQRLHDLLDRVPPEIALLHSSAKLYVPTEADARDGPVYERLVHRATRPAEPPYSGYTNGKSIYRASWVRSHGVTDPHFCPRVPAERRRRASQAIVHHYMIDGEDDFVQTVTSLDRWGLPLDSVGPPGAPPSANDRLGATKKAWWRLYRQGGESALREYYRSTYRISSSALSGLIASGRIVRDDAFAAWSAARSGSPPRGA